MYLFVFCLIILFIMLVTRVLFQPGCISKLGSRLLEEYPGVLLFLCTKRKKMVNYWMVGRKK